MTPKQKQSVAGLGALIRDIPESDISAANAASIAAYDRVFSEAWDAVAKVKAAQAKVAGEEERLLRSMKTKKSRGGGGGAGDGSQNAGEGSGSISTNNNSAPGAVGGNQASIVHSLQQASRSARNRSGDGSDSSGSSLEVIDFDPQVSQVLLRMHQELRNISRQMELMEGILLTQQHMIRNTLTLVTEVKFN